MNYNFTDYIRNSVIRTAVDELVANPQNRIQVVEDDQGRTWSVTNGQSFGIEDNGKTSLLERIRNAVVLFFKCWSSTFRTNFSNAIQAINVASQNINEVDNSDEEDLPEEELDGEDEDLSAQDQQLWDTVVFGKKEWEQIPGVNDVGAEPVLTADQKARLIAKLKGVCPFFNQDDRIRSHRFQGRKDNKYWQTHKVILFPVSINGKPVDMNLIAKIFNFGKPVGNKGTKFGYIAGDDNSNFRTKKAPKSYFAIISLDVIPESRNTNYKTKEYLLKAQGCRFPTPLEALISNLVMNLASRKAGEDYFFGANGFWINYTATDTLFEDYRLIVGAASSSGPGVYCIYEDGDSNVGVAAVEEVL